LHESAIVFRDLKPHNIEFGKDGYCVLQDLALAREFKLSENHGPFTTGYYAPEIIGSDQIGVEADYFSLGVIAY
jgi:serine/threonine protein kinase